MNSEVQAIVDNTDYIGYVIVSLNGIYGKTTCPNKAVSMALDLTRQDSKNIINVYSVGTMGKYAKVPGERYGEDFNWSAHFKN